MKARTFLALAVGLFVSLSHAQTPQAAGDLDGDGRLDFVVESAQGDHGTAVELWLSGQSGAARYVECRSNC